MTAAIKACTDLGATAGTSVAQVASTCDVVFTSLPMPRNVEDVALGPDGIAANARPGTVYQAEAAASRRSGTHH